MICVSSSPGVVRRLLQWPGLWGGYRQPIGPGEASCDELLQRVLVCTVATQSKDGLILLQKSCEKFKIELKIFGWGQTWKGLGWRQRVLYQSLRRYRLKYNYVLFVDGYDCIFLYPLKEIMSKFLSLNTRLLFGAEVVSHPLAPQCYPPSPAPGRYRYLNAGGFIGEIKYVLELMSRLGIPKMKDDFYDQLRYAEAFVSGQTEITLDYQSDIFQCLFFASNDLEIREQRIVNRVTGSMPCIIHGNGGTDLTWATDFVFNQ